MRSGRAKCRIKHNILTILNHELRTADLRGGSPTCFTVRRELSVDDMRTFLRGMNTGATRLRRMVENCLLVELETGEAQATLRGGATCSTISRRCW